MQVCFDFSRLENLFYQEKKIFQNNFIQQSLLFILNTKGLA